MTTYLKIEWSCSDGRNHTEIFERNNDGKLYEIFELLTKLIHRLGKLEEGK
jgi:hypothetical protein